MQKVKCNWIHCDICGAADTTITTSSTKKDWFYDGDFLVCNNCQSIGEVNVDDGIAYGLWETAE